MLSKCISRLTRWAEWLAKILAALKEVESEIQEELERLKRIEELHAGDPLGVYILEARAEFRRTEAADKSKAGRQTEMALALSYTKAHSLGFKGGIKMWHILLQCGRKEDRPPWSPPVG